MRGFIRFTLVVVLLLIGLAAASHSQSARFATGTVTGIEDGDTFTVRYLDGGTGIANVIRPYLLDTPEDPGDCFSGDATEKAEDLLEGNRVWLEHLGKTTGNRLLAFVYVDEARTELFAARMISDGYAWLDARHPEEAGFIGRLHELQMEAQRDRRGLWDSCAATDSDTTTDHVVINEVEANPPGDDAGQEWIELYNPTDSPQDVSGWEIVADRQSSGRVGRIEIPGNSVLQPEGFLVVRGEDQAIDNSDEVIELMDGDRVVDKTTALTDDEYMESAGSLRCSARVPDGGDWLFQTCSPGKANGLVRYDQNLNSSGY